MLEKPQNTVVYTECEAKNGALDFRDSCKISIDCNFKERSLFILSGGMDSSYPISSALCGCCHITVS